MTREMIRGDLDARGESLAGLGMGLLGTNTLIVSRNPTSANARSHCILPATMHPTATASGAQDRTRMREVNYRSIPAPFLPAPATRHVRITFPLTLLQPLLQPWQKRQPSAFTFWFSETFSEFTI